MEKPGRRPFVKASVTAFLLFGLAAPGGAEVTLDGSLGPAGAVGPGLVDGAPTTYLISADLGQTRGGNLFHSFDTFAVAAGESATFTGPSGLENVIGRVTGGSPSNIDGLLSCTIDGANLYLLNPAGLLFGPNAALDVRGSFHASTADYLKFEGGEVFHVNPASSGVLSSAPPEAFGFLGAQPAPIRGENAYLWVPEGETLSLVGGDVEFTGTPVTPDEILYMPAVLAAPGGRINVVAVASPGEVNLGTADLGMGSFSSLGAVSFTEGAKLSVMPYDGTQAAGTIVIRGGQLLFADGGMDVYGNPGGTIDVAGDSLHLDDYYLFAASYGETDHPGTGIAIDLTGGLRMTHGALIDTQTAPVDYTVSDTSGRGGDIRITAADMALGDEVLDDRSFTSIGYYGYIASTTAGSGRSGDIRITTGDAVVRNGFFVQTQCLAGGDAGDIEVTADRLELLDMGNIGVNAFGWGTGGTVSVTARDVVISSANAPSVTQINSITGILAQTGYWSNGRSIRVEVGSLSLLAGGQIGTVLYGEGKGADIDLSADSIRVDGYVADRGTYYLSAVDARVFGADAIGPGGNVAIRTDALTLSEGGAIRTALDDGAPGSAGSITVDAGTIELASRGQIYADSFRGTGNSGDLSITADTLRITGAANVPRPEALDFDFTGLSTTTSEGRGGAIGVALTGDLTVEQEGGIKADTQGSGVGGAIALAARNVFLSSGASVSSASTGTGDAGDVSLTAADSVVLRDSAVTTEASVEADGGNITITTPTLLHLVDSRVTASVGGGPETTGGNIAIDPEFVVLKNGQIVANAYAGTGGNIAIVSDVFLADPASRVDASSQLGIDGQVDIRSPITQIAGTFAPLPSDFRSAAELLREPCMARALGGRQSSLVVSGRAALPIEPGGPQPSPAR